MPVLVMLFASGVQGQKFRSDDPVWEDPDRQPIPMPAVIDDRSMVVDFLVSTFTNRPDEEVPRAENINTLGEVPDSSWFTNRMTLRSMSIPELVKGPDSRDGPDMSKPWTIIRGKTQGITPGFTIVDGRGDTYFIKFDPPGHAQLATSTEVICTKFFHAFGYNVPEYYLARIRREDVQIGKDARLTDENGVKRAWTEKDVDRIFERVAVEDDGTVQVVASLKVDGTVVGPFKYSGTRSDDPNDIFPHENRRELRGLRLLAAWLNHDDSRSMNTLDAYVEPGYIKHHLSDFGSCLGSGSVRIQGRRAGNEYMLEWKPILKAALTFGIWDRPWRYVDYPTYPSIGRFEGDYFQPHLWRPEYPNPAFERMQNGDAFWACRTIARFTDEMIRAIVKTGQLKDREAEEYLITTLIKRRKKILQHYLGSMNPLADFEVNSAEGRPVLRFSNLGEACGVGEAESYEYQWFSFDNLTGARTSLGPVEVVAPPELRIPNDPGTGYSVVLIRTLSPDRKDWKKAVNVYLDHSPLRVIGIERE